MEESNTIPKKSKIDYASDFKISRMKPKIKATDPHKHDEYHELIYLTGGTGFHTIDLQTYQIDVPSLFLVKAGEVHYWEFTEVPEGYVVIFRSDFLAHLSTDGIYSSFNQTRNRYFPLGVSNYFPFTSLFELIETEYSSGDHFSNRVIASSLELIFTQMFRISRQNRQTDLAPREKTFQKFQELMDSHIHECYL
ncbi:MAG TPA: AraC family ligand binding domain-containing protein, partial [Fodinibius sp.]|nr:AraC family ligand binding domain-containing protein [Fodinibius sp.]